MPRNTHSREIRRGAFEKKLEKKFKIEIIDIHWIDKTDNVNDLCPHGKVKVRIGNNIIVDEG